MAQNMDPGTRAKYLSVLSNWRTDTYVNFCRRPQEWIWRELASDPRLVAQQMFNFVRGGGVVKRVKENGNAEDYSNEFHDDLVFVFKGKTIYVETIFHEDRDADGCHIDVVSMKYHKK
jgi:hypothetical protein